MAEHDFLEFWSSKTFCENYGTIYCVEFVFPGKIDSCVSPFCDSDLCFRHGVLLFFCLFWQFFLPFDIIFFVFFLMYLNVCVIMFL